MRSQQQAAVLQTYGQAGAHPQTTKHGNISGGTGLHSYGGAGQF